MPILITQTIEEQWKTTTKKLMVFFRVLLSKKEKKNAKNCS
jgi:hypothetical protein